MTITTEPSGQHHLTRNGSGKLYKDAPIRHAILECSKCKHCTKVLFYCDKYKIKKGVKNGFVVIQQCSGFEDYREL